MATKDRLHRIVDQLPDWGVPAAEEALEKVREKVREMMRMGGHRVAVDQDSEGRYVARVPTLRIEVAAWDLEELEVRLREALELCRSEAPEEVEAVLRYMGPPGHAGYRSLWSAPFDDERVTDDDRRAIEQAERDLRSGTGSVSHEAIKREFGAA